MSTLHSALSLNHLPQPQGVAPCDFQIQSTVKETQLRAKLGSLLKDGLTYLLIGNESLCLREHWAYMWLGGLWRAAWEWQLWGFGKLVAIVTKCQRSSGPTWLVMDHSHTCLRLLLESLDNPLSQNQAVHTCNTVSWHLHLLPSSESQIWLKEGTISIFFFFFFSVGRIGDRRSGVS